MMMHTLMMFICFGQLLLALGWVVDFVTFVYNLYTAPDVDEVKQMTDASISI